MASIEHRARTVALAKIQVTKSADNIRQMLGIEHDGKPWGEMPYVARTVYGANRQCPEHRNMWLWEDLETFLKAVEQKLTEPAAKPKPGKPAKG